MSEYQVSAVPDGIEVRHVAIFPLCIGGLVTFGGLLALVLWGRDLQVLNGLDFWMPLLISVGATFGGLYLIFIHPTVKRIRFSSDANETLQVLDSGLLRSHERSVRHEGLGSLSILERDNDGKWYIPVIELQGGQSLELGFGCATAVAAQNVIDRIIEMQKSARGAG